MKLPQDNLFLRPIIQFGLVLFSVFFTLAISYYRLSNSPILDPQPSLYAPSQEIKDKQHIVVGFAMHNFLLFDIINNDFLLDATVWFAFDATTISIKDLDDFSFSKAEIVQKAGPYLETKDGKITARYDIRLRFSTNLIYRLFPLDRHRIYLTLNNKALSTDNVLFSCESKSLVVSKTIYTFGWSVENQRVQCGAGRLNFADKQFSFPRIIFSIDFAQTSMRQFTFIVLPLFILLFLAIFAFALNLRKDFEVIMAIAGASIAALLSYRFVIEGMSPKVTYYMLSDLLFLLFLVLLFVVIFIDIFYRQHIEERRGSIVFLFYGAFLCAWSYLLFVW